MGKAAGVATYDDEGNLIEFMPSNFVFGIANLDGRPAVVSGDDFTVRGGSNDASISAARGIRDDCGRGNATPSCSPARRDVGWRIGEDDRTGRAHVYSVASRLAHGVRSPQYRPISLPRARLGGGFRSRSCSCVALFGHGSGYLADDDRRTSTRRTGWSGAVSSTNLVTLTFTLAMAPSMMRSTQRQKHSKKRCSFCRICRPPLTNFRRLKIGAMTLLGAMSGSSMWCHEILDRATT